MAAATLRLVSRVLGLGLETVSRLVEPALTHEKVSAVVAGSGNVRPDRKYLAGYVVGLLKTSGVSVSLRQRDELIKRERRLVLRPPGVFV